jgi:hypothetical protein
MKEDVEVLAVDSDQRIVESLAGRPTQVVSADTTSEDTLRQLSVHEFYRVVIAVGSNLEASILTATVCLGFETPEIWASRTPRSSASWGCTIFEIKTMTPLSPAARITAQRRTDSAESFMVKR